jgi:hypothetical protein
MPITTEEGRGEILADLSDAIERLALSAQRFGDAYEVIPAAMAGERLEANLYMPAQKAYGRCLRAYRAFAERYGFTPQTFAPATQGAPSHGAHGLIDQGVAAAADADAVLAELQDSGRPIEFGDPELRAALVDVRGSLGQIPGAARDLLRTLGR